MKDEKISYKLIGKIKLKDELFYVLEDERYQKYYLKTLENEQLIYPTLEEFQSLNKLFSVNAETVNAMAYEKNTMNSKKVKEERFRFIPKVIYNGVAISLFSALCLCGCGQINDNSRDDLGSSEEVTTLDSSDITNEETTTTYLATDLSETTTTYITTLDSESSVLSSTTITKSEDAKKLEQFGEEVDQLEENVIAIHIQQMGYGKLCYCRDMEEFKRLAGIVGNKTIDDVKKALENNQAIQGQYKQWIREGLDAIKQSKLLDDFDFSILYSHMSKMTVQEKTAEQIKEELGLGQAIAYFESSNSVVTVNPENVTKGVFLHEALGHPINEGYEVKPGYGKAILGAYRKCAVLNNSDDGSLYSSYFLGTGLQEGKADWIVRIALSSYDGPYTEEYEAIRMMAELAQVPMKDVLTGGVSKLIEGMHSCGIKNASKYINCIDNICTAEQIGTMELAESEKLGYNMKLLFNEYAVAQMKNGVSKEQIKVHIKSIFDNSEVKRYATCINGSYEIDSVEVAELCEEVMNQIDELKLEKENVRE